MRPCDRWESEKNRREKKELTHQSMRVKSTPQGIGHIGHIGQADAGTAYARPLSPVPANLPRRPISALSGGADERTHIGGVVSYGGPRSLGVRPPAQHPMKPSEPMELASAQRAPTSSVRCPTRPPDCCQVSASWVVLVAIVNQTLCVTTMREDWLMGSTTKRGRHRLIDSDGAFLPDWWRRRRDRCPRPPHSAAMALHHPYAPVAAWSTSGCGAWWTSGRLHAG